MIRSIAISAVVVASLSVPLSAQRISPRLLEATKVINSATLAQAKAGQIADQRAREAAEAAARESAAARERQAQALEAERVAQESRNQFRVTFIDLVGQLRQETSGHLGTYQTIFTSLAIGAVALALMTSVFAFLKWSVVAGVCSIVTTAVLTAPNIFSVRENLDFYRYIDNQSYALQLEAQLMDQPAQTDVERWKDRWLKLATVVGSPPSVKDPDQLTRTIVQPGG